MFTARVRTVGLTQRGDLPGGDFAVLRGQRQHFVAARLNGTRLMDVDVGALRGHHALMRAQRGGNDGQIRLRAADQKLHVRLRGAAQFLDRLARLRAVDIFAIAGRLLQVGFLQALQNRRMRTFAVIAFKSNHTVTSIFFAAPGTSLPGQTPRL